MTGVRRIARASPGSDPWAYSRQPRQPGNVYAEFPRRAAAFVIDLGLATVAIVALAQLASFVVRSPPYLYWWEVSGLNLLSLLLLAIVCVLPTAWVAYLWHHGRTTPGHRLFGLSVVQRSTGERLAALASFSRWVLLYAPIALWAYPVIVSSVYDPSPFLILIQLPRFPFLGTALSVAWYLMLAASVIFDRRRGRGIHDRVAGSVVVRPGSRLLRP